MASSNCIRCMMNEQASKAPAAAAAFDPTLYGTCKGDWRADDYAANTAAMNGREFY